jgi:colicin import membrane protein
MIPKFVVGVAIASLMFVTSGCVSKSNYDTKVAELKTQADKLANAEKAQKDAEAKIKAMEGEVAAAKEATDKAEKEHKAVADKVNGLEKDLAAAKEAAEKAVKNATEKANKDIATAKDAAEKAQKEAEAKLKALEEKPATEKPTGAKLAPK